MPDRPCKPPRMIKRQKLATRVKHWIRAICLFFLLLSGLQITGGLLTVMAGAVFTAAGKNHVTARIAFVANVLLAGISIYCSSRYSGQSLIFLLFCLYFISSFGQGILLLCAYSLGLGVPFLIAGLAVNRFFAASGRLKPYMRQVEYVSGALLMRGHQHCDTTLLVEHRVPRCVSRELFKAVLDNEARVVIQGKIIVSPGAQKTDGKQMAQALLLSETAEFDSKPELEIFADDVVCGHGSTSGQIDEDLLFYLESRGIPEVQARALLIQAFVGEAIERIEHEPLREALSKASAEWLGVSFD